MVGETVSVNVSIVGLPFNNLPRKLLSRVIGVMDSYKIRRHRCLILYHETNHRIGWQKCYHAYGAWLFIRVLELTGIYSSARASALACIIVGIVLVSTMMHVASFKPFYAKEISWLQSKSKSFVRI